MRLTAQEFCNLYRITSHARRVRNNPHMTGKDMDHWSVTLYRHIADDSNVLTVFFSKGFGHHGAIPTAHEVVECLASDAAPFGANGRGITFEEWCSEYGYDEDSRRAERTFNACKESARDLHTFLGPVLFATAVEEGFES